MFSLKNLGIHIKNIKKRPKAQWNLLKFFVFNNFHPINAPFCPTRAEIEISTKCNLKCERCERETAPKVLLGQNISIETIKKISPILPYLQLVSFVSGLGEPLLNPDFWKIQKFIKSFGPDVAYTTHGIFLNKENIEKTIKTKTDIVVVSLDSLKRENYQRIRGNVSLDKVINNLENLVKTKNKYRLKYPEIRIGFAFQKSTIEEMPEMVEFARQTGVDMVYCTALIANKKELADESIYPLGFNYVSQIFQKSREKAKKLGIKIRLPEITVKNSKQMCSYPWRAMFISHNGDVSCSSYFRYPKAQFFYAEKGEILNRQRNVPGVFLGNVNKESILKIWNNEAYRNLRKGMKFGEPQSPCDKCYFRHNLH